jgi:hypothetical protein
MEFPGSRREAERLPSEAESLSTWELHQVINKRASPAIDSREAA